MIIKKSTLLISGIKNPSLSVVYDIKFVIALFDIEVIPGEGERRLVDIEIHLVVLYLDKVEIETGIDLVTEHIILKWSCDCDQNKVQIKG
jgi:hypothetical protein